jgi:DNA-cytosine methyltransferase
MKKEIVVLSLFDGISCGRVALNRAGKKVDTYYSSEIDKTAISIANFNFPEDSENRLGDVLNWRGWDIDFSSIDIILGGFPCQSWSVGGKQLGDKDPRGELFWVLLDVAKHIQSLNPYVVFMFENVQMKKEFEEYITFHTTEALGDVNKIMIDSRLVSAQSRKRYYWTNIHGIEQPLDKNIRLIDITHEYADPYSDTYTEDYLSTYKVPYDSSFILLEKEVLRGKIGFFRKYSQANGVYDVHGKGVSLCGSAGGGAAKMGQYLFPVIDAGRINKTQNGRRISDGYKSNTLTAQDRHGVLTNGYIRKLTPVECERLQTLPDAYTQHGTKPNGDTVEISNSQRYKCLGNGWTVDVISHILSSM